MTTNRNAAPLFERVMRGEKTLAFGLVGERLGHSHSPAIHALLGSAPYEAVEVPHDCVEGFFASRAFSGLNVTIPYKKQAVAACDELSPTARRLGNANTLVVRADGTLFGDNTDYYGFWRQLASCEVDLAGASCLVLGDGGAAATVRAVLADAGAAEVVTATRRGGEAPEVCDEAGRSVVTAHIRLEQVADRDDAAMGALRGRIRAIVNATPAGMYPHNGDAPLVDLDLFPALACVCDLVYNPLATRLIQDARSRGVPAAGGLLMLVAQAKRSSDRFLGIERGDEAIDAVFSRMRSRLSNVSLIGMPGCGKSQTGRALADMLGFEFVDVDDLIVQKAGMPIPQVFKDCGEEGFRSIETDCTSEALARPGRVVATGGGVVTRPRNLPYLRQNGPVVLLTRGLEADDGEELELDGRPLSQRHGIEQLRAERAPLYRAWADLRVAPDPAGAEATAGVIAAALRDACGIGPERRDAPIDR